CGASCWVPSAWCVLRASHMAPSTQHRTWHPAPSTQHGLVLPQARRSRLQLAALVENLDAPLGVLQPRVAEARELDAALVERQRRLERQVARFELLHDLFELAERSFEILDGGFHEVLAHPCVRGPNFSSAIPQRS